MKKHWSLIVRIVIAALLAGGGGFIWWRYAPLTDGVYVVTNGTLAWQVAVSSGVLRTIGIENRRTHEQLPVAGQDFALHIGSAKSIGWVMELKKPGDQYPPFTMRDAITVTPDNCRAVWLIRGWRTRTFILRQRDLQVEIVLHFTTEPGVPWLTRTLSLRSAGPVKRALDGACHARWRVRAAASYGGRGQPLVLNDTWFMALDHPWSLNTVEDDAVVLKHAPGRLFDSAGITLPTMIVGGGARGGGRAAAEAYISRVRLPARSISLYNTWCDLRGDELSEDSMVAAAEELRKNLEPRNALFDIFAIDDGWQNPQSIWGVRTQRLPRGLAGLRKRIEETGFGIGIWLPLSGLNLDIAWGVRQGYEAAHTRFYCMFASNYNSVLRYQLKNLIADGNLQYF